ncbi:MAG: Rab family GTPase [Candidatus Helarchaeota archaeon]
MNNRQIKDIIKGIIYSIFDEKLGPIPKAWVPSDLSNEIIQKYSIKTILSLSKFSNDKTKSFGVFPLNELNMLSISRRISIDDPTKRGGYSEASLSIIFNEEDDVIFYKYIKNFQKIISNSADKIKDLEEKKENIEKIKTVIKNLQIELIQTLKELRDEEILLSGAEEFPEISKFENVLGEYKFKIIFLGDPGAGKTSIVLRYTNQAFRRTYIPTLGVNITEKKFVYKGNFFRFIIWDIGGQNKFKVMRKYYYDGANGVFFVFDLTRIDSFKNIEKWVADIKKYLGDNIIALILANKCDLKNERNITKNNINKLSKSLKINYLETSALTGENINVAFEKLADLLLKNIEELY